MNYFRHKLKKRTRESIRTAVVSQAQLLFFLFLVGLARYQIKRKQMFATICNLFFIYNVIKIQTLKILSFMLQSILISHGFRAIRIQISKKIGHSIRSCSIQSIMITFTQFFTIFSRTLTLCHASITY